MRRRRNLFGQALQRGIARRLGRQAVWAQMAPDDQEITKQSEGYGSRTGARLSWALRMCAPSIINLKPQ